ncbi:MAG: hypothetical protein ACPGVO_10500 [Spirulinaceae cyanobacterium]
MSFTQFTDLASTVLAFSLQYQEANFIVETPIEVEPFFCDRLTASLEDGVVFNSEAAICETIIAPMLRETWLKYKQSLQLWSHQPLRYDDALSGIPDYMVSRRSSQGKIILERPYLIVVEAKKDDFDGGWGQCLAELVAAQKLNQAATDGDPTHEQTIFGIVANGKLWEFGQLQGTTFTKNSKYYTLEQLEILMGAIDFLFAAGVRAIAEG